MYSYSWDLIIMLVGKMKLAGNCRQDASTSGGVIDGKIWGTGCGRVSLKVVGKMT